MKKQKLTIDKFAKALVLAGLLLGVSMNVSANKNQTQANSTNIQPAVQYVSSDKASTTLLVQFENPSKASVTVMVRDEAGVTLFRQAFTDASFAKTFKLLNDANGEPGDKEIIISVPGSKDIVYNVASNIRVVSDVRVTKF